LGTCNDQKIIHKEIDGVGLANVNARFARAFKNAILIESSPNEGTTIRLVIDKYKKLARKFC
jgi:sensor histidine kinase YesM